jgi:hypothetical protein
MTVTPEEEIYADIKQMGYILAKSKRQYPSLYKLADGTIIKIEVLVSHLVPDPRRPEGFNINSQNIISSFVPTEKRKPEAFTPYSTQELNVGIVDEDLDFVVLQENFSAYELSNDFILSVKPVLAQVKKTKFYSITGEPVYTMNFNPVIKFKKNDRQI